MILFIHHKITKMVYGKNNNSAGQTVNHELINKMDNIIIHKYDSLNINIINDRNKLKQMIELISKVSPFHSFDIILKNQSGVNGYGVGVLRNIYSECETEIKNMLVPIENTSYYQINLEDTFIKKYIYV